MEKKITQRIVGILVIGSLAVIALPFFFGKNNEVHEEVVANVTAMPKQDDTAPVTSLSDSTQTPPSNAALTSETAQPNPNNDNSAQVAAAPASTANNSPAPAASPAQNAAQAANVPDGTVSNNSLDLTQQIINSAEHTPIEQPAVPQPVPVKTKKVSHSQKLTSSHKQAWVIQMGSFKNKDNAKRLTSKLRASGFKAFMHTVKNGKRERVRVFIGPEYKQASAVKLSNRVNQTIKMKGIVVSYKPLA